MPSKVSRARPAPSASTSRTQRAPAPNISRARSLGPGTASLPIGDGPHTSSFPTGTSAPEILSAPTASKLESVVASRPDRSLPYAERVEALKKWVDTHRNLLSDPRYSADVYRLIQAEESSLKAQDRQDIANLTRGLRTSIESARSPDEIRSLVESWVEANKDRVQSSSEGVSEVNRILAESDELARKRDLEQVQSAIQSFDATGLSYAAHAEKLNNFIQNNEDILGRGDENYARSKAFLEKQEKILQQKNAEELTKAKAQLQLEGSSQDKIQQLNAWIENNSEILGRGDSNFQAAETFIKTKSAEIERFERDELKNTINSLQLSGSYDQQVQQLNTWIENNSDVLGRGESNFRASETFIRQKERELERLNVKEFEEVRKQLDWSGSTEKKISNLNAWLEANADVLGRGQNFYRTEELIKSKERLIPQAQKQDFQDAVSQLDFTGTYEERVEKLQQWQEQNKDVLGVSYDDYMSLISQKQEKLADISKSEFEQAKSSLLDNWKEGDFEKNTEVLTDWIDSNRTVLERPEVNPLANELLELKQSKIQGDYNKQFDSLIEGFKFEGSDYFTKSQQLSEFVDENRNLLGYEERFDEAQNWLEGQLNFLDSFKQESFDKAMAKKPTGAKGAEYESELQSWLAENPVVTLEEFAPMVQSKIDAEFQKSLKKQYDDALKKKPTGELGADYFSEVERWIENNPIVVSGDDFFGQTQKRIQQESERARSNVRVVDNYTLSDIKTSNKFTRDFRSDGSLRSAEIKDSFKMDNRRTGTYTPLRITFDQKGNIVRIEKEEIFPIFIDDLGNRPTEYAKFRTLDVEYNSDGSVKRNLSQAVPASAYNSDQLISSTIYFQQQTGRKYTTGELFDIWSRELDDPRGYDWFDPRFQDFVRQVNAENVRIRADQKAAETARSLQKYGEAQFSKGELTTGDDFWNLISDGRKEIPMAELAQFRPILEDWSLQNRLITDVRDDFVREIPSVTRPDLDILEKARRLEGDLALSKVALKNLEAGNISEIQRADIESRFKVQESIRRIDDLDMRLGSFDFIDDSSIDEYNRNLVLRNLFVGKVDKGVGTIQEIEGMRQDSIERLTLAEQAARDLPKSIVAGGSLADTLGQQQQAKFDLQVARRDFLQVGDLYGETFADQRRATDPGLSFTDRLSVGFTNTLDRAGNWKDGFRLSTSKEREAQFLDVSKSVPSERATIAATPGATRELFADSWQNQGPLKAIMVGATFGAIRGIQMTGQGLQAASSGLRKADDMYDSFLRSESLYSTIMPDPVVGVRDSVLNLRQGVSNIATDIVGGVGDWAAYKPAEATFTVGVGIAAMGASAAIGSASAASKITTAGIKAKVAATPLAVSTKSMSAQILATPFTGTTLKAIGVTAKATSKVGGLVVSSAPKLAMGGLKSVMIANVGIQTTMAEEGERARTFGTAVAPLIGLKVGAKIGKSTLSIGQNLGIYDPRGTAKLAQIKWGSDKARSGEIMSELRRIQLDTTTGRTGISGIKGARDSAIVSVNDKFTFKDVFKPTSAVRKIDAMRQSVKSDAAVVGKLKDMTVKDIKTLQTYDASQIGPKMRGVTDLTKVEFRQVLRDSTSIRDYQDFPATGPRPVDAKLVKPVSATVGGEPVKVTDGRFFQRPGQSSNLDFRFQTQKGGKLYRVTAVSDDIKTLTTISESALNKGLTPIKSSKDLFSAPRAPGFGVQPKGQALQNQWSVQSFDISGSPTLKSFSDAVPTVTASTSKIIGKGLTGKKFSISPDQFLDDGIEVLKFRGTPEQLTKTFTSQGQIGAQTGTAFKSSGLRDIYDIKQLTTTGTTLTSKQQLALRQVADSPVKQPSFNVEGSVDTRTLLSAKSGIRDARFLKLSGEGKPVSSVSSVEVADMVPFTRAQQVAIAKSWVSELGASPFSKATFKITPGQTVPATQTLDLGVMKVTAPKVAFKETADIAGRFRSTLDLTQTTTFNLGIKTNQIVMGSLTDAPSLTGAQLSALGRGAMTAGGFAIKAGVVTGISGLTGLGGGASIATGLFASGAIVKSSAAKSLFSKGAGVQTQQSLILGDIQPVAVSKSTASTLGKATAKFTPSIAKAIPAADPVKIGFSPFAKLGPAVQSGRVPSQVSLGGGFNVLGAALSFRSPEISASPISRSQQVTMFSQSVISDGDYFTSQRPVQRVVSAPSVQSEFDIRPNLDFDFGAKERSRLESPSPSTRQFVPSILDRYTSTERDLILSRPGLDSLGRATQKGVSIIDSITGGKSNVLSMSQSTTVNNLLTRTQLDYDTLTRTMTDTRTITDTDTMTESLLDTETKTQLRDMLDSQYRYDFTPSFKHPGFKPPKIKPPKIQPPVPIIDIPEFDLEFEDTEKRKKAKRAALRKGVREFSTLDLLGGRSKQKIQPIMSFL